MRMVLVVDAQNIIHCPKKNGSDESKFAKEMYSIGHLFVKTNEYRANLRLNLYLPLEDQKKSKLVRSNFQEEALQKQLY